MPELYDDDIAVIQKKGFELAKNLLDPDTLFSVSVLQQKKEYGPFKYGNGKLHVTTKEGIIDVEPDTITEQGVAVCKNDKGIYFSAGERKGLAMGINADMCKTPKEYLGSLHTHPGGSTAPSTGDLGASRHNNDKVMCIASRTAINKFKVTCYVPKNEFLDEEIMEVERKQAEIMRRYSEFPITFEDEQRVMQFPSYDFKKMKWFEDSLFETLDNSFEIHNSELIDVE